MPVVRRLLAVWIVASLPALAEEALQRRDYDVAIRYLDTYLTFNQDSARVHLILSWACLKKGDHARALDASNEAIRLDPDNPNGYRQRAACHAARADYAEAIHDCDEALRLAPDHADILRQRANFHHELKHYAEMLADCETLLRLDPKDSSVRLGLIDLLATCPDSDVRDLARAEEEAKRLDAHAHSSHRCYAKLAALRARRGELSEAISWQRKAVACADQLDKEEKDKAALVLKLYQTRKKKADQAARRRVHRRTSPQHGIGK